MNIKELHEKLTALLPDHALTEVTIDKETFNSPYEDEGAMILNVESAGLSVVDVKTFDGDQEEDYPEEFLVLKGE